MVQSKNNHRPRWLPWFAWLLWAPVDALGCRNEQTGVTEHSKITTALLILAALVLHAFRCPLAWWELLILGTLCFSSLGLYTTLLNSGIFKGTFSESRADTHTETVSVVRQERDPESGIDPA